MKKFAIFILMLLTIVSTTMFVLDWSYSYLYNNSNPRNKLQYILKLKNQEYDIVFIGSSRVANHIDSELFNSLSQKKTVNFGVEGAQLADNLLQLKLLLNQNRVKYIFLQLDTNMEWTSTSNISQAEAMPFLNENSIVDAHTRQFAPNYYALKYIPFYRYAINDAKIGFRELFFSAVNKKPKTDPSIGFTPKLGNSIPSGSVEIIREEKGLIKNPILQEIKNLCQANNVKLVLFISPFCSKISPDEYIRKMKTFEPELIDLTKGYPDSLFYNCGHLNLQGAEIFTQQLYDATKARI